MSDDRPRVQPTPRPQPTYRPTAGLASVLERNIRALEAREQEERAGRSRETRIADAVTRFAGSMTFVYLHLALVGAWVAVNAGLVPGAPRFDPTFVILATVASVEAIFLSTFVLISQNRAAELSERRAALDLQIGLLAEHEVTRLITLTTRIAETLGLEEAGDPELAELGEDVAPEAVLDEIAAVDRDAAGLAKGRRPTEQEAAAAG